MLLVKMGPVSSRFVAVNYLAPLTRLPAINHRKPPRHLQHGRTDRPVCRGLCLPVLCGPPEMSQNSNHLVVYFNPSALLFVILNSKGYYQ